MKNNPSHSGFWSRFFHSKTNQSSTPEPKPDNSPIVSSPEPAQNKKVLSLDEVISRHCVSCNFTVAQQQIWLRRLNQTICTILVGGSEKCIDYLLQPHVLKQFGDMRDILARVAFSVNHALSITDLEKAVNTDSVLNMVRTYCILDAYTGILKPQYCESINTAKAYIRSALEKADLSKLPAERSKELYWAPLPPQSPNAPDFTVHVFPGAQKLMNEGVSLPYGGILLAAYEFVSPTDPIIRLDIMSVQNAQSGDYSIPLYTDLELMQAIHSPTVTVGLVDYPTACAICRANGSAVSGILINPGGEDSKITQDQLAEEEGLPIFVKH